ncbi:Uncharacterised protein [Chlamydia trachomatis]|nr:Uncharacterised protein [Chlamydia trachomatis]
MAKNPFQKRINKELRKQKRVQERILNKPSLLERYFYRLNKATNATLLSLDHRSMKFTAVDNTETDKSYFFVYTASSDNFENIFNKKEEVLIKKLAKQFTVPPHQQIEIFKNNAECLEYAISIDYKKDRIKIYHGILVIISKDRNVLNSDYIYRKVDEMFN